MGTITRITVKDLRQRLRDRSILVWGIVVPFAITWVLSLVMSPVLDGDVDIRLAIHDADGSVADSLVDSLADVGFDTRRVASVDAARGAVDDDTADAAILIPVFDADVDPIVVYGRRDAGLARLVAESVADTVADRSDAGRLVVSAGLDPALAGAVGTQPAPVVLEDLPAGSRVLDATSHLSVGLALFFLFFTVQAAILNIVEERTNGTLQRLLMAPVPRASVLFAKTVSAAITGLISMTALAVASSLVLDATWGPWWGVALLSLAAVVAAMGLGALIGTLTRTAEQANQYAGIVATVLGLLGGVFIPIATGPGLLDVVSRISPHRWLLDGFGANAGTGSVGEVLTVVAVVTGFGVVTGAMALYRAGSLTGVH